ncbi:hypothetical protein C1645_814668 [Glomus cerebriforme]|uniref:BTB/POZ domain-containing protein n=1 Tax=Glomus cerebriforme TaxID=658196 RepID=A0A397TKI3_9GLOM|nr:hypothetical protein C1645_814668 [Glomus cerebriforme]
MATQFLPNLSQDLTKLLDNKKNYDFIINVGNYNNNIGREFSAHSIILETRSAYFEDALSNGLARKENNIFILDFPDISVNLFNILIRYIYGGTINIEHKEAAEILNLLVACEKLKLKELYDFIQDYFIENHQAWLFQNFGLIKQISFKYSEFTKLQNYWKKIVCEQPEILFNAIDFTSVDKETLLSLYKMEDLCMGESELWDHIIRWGKAQHSELPKEIINWTTNDFGILKKTIEDFIPHIRFYDISSDDFYYKIMPYSTILSNDLYQDLSGYHLVSNWQPKFNNLISRNVIIPIDSKLINGEQAALISSWIQGNEENKISTKFKKIYYEFQLLTRGSRDGFTGEIFHKMCDNKGPTITIMRLKNESSILGGYNPINWDYTKHGNYELTPDSFIFSLDKEIILSKVQNNDNAIKQSANYRGPNFVDLQLASIFNVSLGVKFKKIAYYKEIHNEGDFIVDEYEVFSVVRKRNK